MCCACQLIHDKLVIKCACMQFALITGSALLTDRQKLWRDIMRQAGSLKAVRKLQRPPGRIRVCKSDKQTSASVA